ncbi:MAG: ribonuclease P protein component [Candidatus Nealsonbacteria bacterium]|nr:ribonuclease P protein component [Candidatus Nealsonbacteria bacterium]
MLPSRHRLRQKRDFAHVLKNGRSQNNQFLSIKFVGNDHSFSRFGFLASKKTFNRASQRNRIKRKLREAMRSNLFLVKPGWDLVLSARKDLEKKDLREAAEMILFFLKKADLITPNDISGCLPAIKK